MPRFLIFSFICCLLPLPVMAVTPAAEFQNLLAKSAGDERFKQTGRLAIASWQTGDYFTANLEFKRLLLFAALKPGSRLQNNVIEYTLLTAHAQSMKQQTDYWLNNTAAYLNRLQAKAVFQETPAQTELRQFLHGDLFYTLGEYGKAASSLEACPGYRTLAGMRSWQKNGSLYSRAAEVKAAEFKKECRGLPATTAMTGRANFEALRKNYLAQGRHSNWVAVPLSVLLPGSGHIYNGRTVDGISSFFVTAVFAGLSVWAFSENSVALGSIAGAGALAFYGGNIYGSYNSTNDYNYNLDEKFMFRLELEFRPLRKEADR